MFNVMQMFTCLGFGDDISLEIDEMWLETICLFFTILHRYTSNAGYRRVDKSRKH